MAQPGGGGPPPAERHVFYLYDETGALQATVPSFYAWKCVYYQPVKFMNPGDGLGQAPVTAIDGPALLGDDASRLIPPYFGVHSKGESVYPSKQLNAYRLVFDDVTLGSGTTMLQSGVGFLPLVWDTSLSGYWRDSRYPNEDLNGDDASGSELVRRLFMGYRLDPPSWAGPWDGHPGLVCNVLVQGQRVVVPDPETIEIYGYVGDFSPYLAFAGVLEVPSTVANTLLYRFELIDANDIAGGTYFDDSAIVQAINDMHVTLSALHEDFSSWADLDYPGDLTWGEFSAAWDIRSERLEEALYGDGVSPGLLTMTGDMLEALKQDDPSLVDPDPEPLELDPADSGVAAGAVAAVGEVPDTPFQVVDVPNSVVEQPLYWSFDVSMPGAGTMPVSLDFALYEDSGLRDFVRLAMTAWATWVAAGLIWRELEVR